MPTLKREFSNNDEETKKVVLMVIKQCVSCPGVDSQYVRTEIIPEYFKNYWVKRMASERRNYRQLVETTVEIASKVGSAEILSRILDDIKDENELFRKMVMETIEKTVSTLGVADIDLKLEMRLMDGILWAFHEQQSEDTQTMLNGFGAVVNTLGSRAKPYFGQVCGVI
jgi:splicing factor 3B subunit 1